MKYQEIEGNLITLAKEGRFDVIAHGCNCFCTMGAGIAPQMAKAFGCDKYSLEGSIHSGDINKLGNIDYGHIAILPDGRTSYGYGDTLDQYRHARKGLLTVTIFSVVNCYTQYNYGMNHLDGSDKPFDYEAFDLCLRKINHIFKEKHIGLPQIGCGLAGGDWDVVKRMIQRRLKDMDVTIVIYDNKGV